MTWLEKLVGLANVFIKWIYLLSFLYAWIIEINFYLFISLKNIVKVIVKVSSKVCSNFVCSTPTRFVHEGMKQKYRWVLIDKWVRWERQKCDKIVRILIEEAKGFLVFSMWAIPASFLSLIVRLLQQINVKKISIQVIVLGFKPVNHLITC